MLSGSGTCHRERPLEDLFDHVNRPVGANLPSSYGEQPVQEGVFRFGSLETRHSAKVGSSWRSVVTDALERHVDERAVVSSVMRRSSSVPPSARLSVQSPPPGSTLPRSRGPSKGPPAIGAVTRVPCGTAPIFCAPAAASRNVIKEREC